MRGQVLIAVSALALAFVQPASAQQYPTYQDGYVAQQQACQQSHTNRTVGGAVIGGAAGAVIGNNVSSHGHHDRGSLLGGIAGAIIGGVIGNSTANGQPQCQAEVSGNYDPNYAPAQPPYDDAQPPYDGGKYADNSSPDDQAYDPNLDGGPDDSYGNGK